MLVITFSLLPLLNVSALTRNYFFNCISTDENNLRASHIQLKYTQTLNQLNSDQNLLYRGLESCELQYHGSQI
jgi:hypothetical protein